MATLALALQAFGGGVSVLSIAAMCLAATAFATALPIPGGVGSIETALAAGLSAVGAAGGSAVAAAGPVVEVNRAVAHGRVCGPHAGLAVLDEADTASLNDSSLVPSVPPPLSELSATLLPM